MILVQLNKEDFGYHIQNLLYLTVLKYDFSTVKYRRRF